MPDAPFIHVGVSDAFCDLVVCLWLALFWHCVVPDFMRFLACAFAPPSLTQVLLGLGGDAHRRYLRWWTFFQVSL